MNHSLLIAILASLINYCPIFSSETAVNRKIAFSIDGHGQVEISELSVNGSAEKLLEIKYEKSVIIYDNTKKGVQPIYSGYSVDLDNGNPVLYLMVDHPGNGGHRSILKYKLFKDKIDFCNGHYYIGNCGHANQVNMWKFNSSN